MRPFSIPELCELWSLRNSRGAIILAGRLGRNKLGDKRDKDLGRRTNHPTKGNKKGDNGRQWETRGDKGEAPSNTGKQERDARGDKTLVGKAEKPSNTGTHVGRQWEKIGDKGGKTSGRRARHPTHTWGTWPHQGNLRRQWDTMGDKGRQDLGKADIPPNKGSNISTICLPAWLAGWLACFLGCLLAPLSARRQWETRVEKTL